MAVAFRSGNPALGERTFEQWRTISMPQSDTMSLNGTVNKTALLLFIAVFTGSFTWKLATDGNPAVFPLAVGGAFLAFVTAMVTIFKKDWSPVSAPLYAALEGLFLGGISAVYNMRYEGIVGQAVVLTAGTLFALLMAYRSGLIKPTENFKLGVVAATGGICVLYLVSILFSVFGVHNAIPMIHSSSPIGIGFSVVVVIIAALNLVLDFDFIESGVEMGAPKYMEWYGAFGLMVTLVWLYLEILRLLAKLRER
ncbi:MAG: Bax inhibitor-1/YccA family protein [Candidatus Eremiobacterota bacterium]